MRRAIRRRESDRAPRRRRPRPAGDPRPRALPRGYPTPADRRFRPAVGCEPRGRSGDPALGWPLTDEERLLQQTARDFARRELAPGAVERDEREAFDRHLFEGMAALGLAAAPFAEEIGGSGFSHVRGTVAPQETARAEMASAITLSVHI